VKSCTVFAVQADGGAVITIEGIAAPDGTLHALQEGFSRDARPAMRVLHPGHDHRAYRLLQETPNPTEAEIRAGISGNICRCTGYQNIRQGYSIRRREARRRAFPGGRGMNDVSVPPFADDENARPRRGALAASPAASRHARRRWDGYVVHSAASWKRHAGELRGGELIA